MRVRTLFRASLAYYLRSHLVVMLGAAVASAILTGALVVGDSMRGSLRDMALRRLGPVQDAVISPRFVRATLAEANQWVGLILVQGSAAHAETKARTARVQILGVDESFWKTWAAGSAPSEPDAITVNEALATDLGAKVGDEVILQLGSASEVPIDTLLGQRDKTALGLRRRIQRILPPDGPGEFCPRPQAQSPRSVFLPLGDLQRALKQAGRINVVLSAPTTTPSDDDHMRLAALQGRLDQTVRLDDFELALRFNERAGCLSLESRRLLLENEVEEAARKAAFEIGAPAVPLLSYLVNTISNASQSPRRETPYSTALASDLLAIASAQFKLVDGSPAPRPDDGEILINEWLAQDLNARVGDKLKLSYYVSAPMGRLETHEAEFSVRGIVAMRDWAIDPGLTPTFEGITDSKRMTDWDPPFPVDMKRIRPKDEEYWDAYRATPKAFINYSTGTKIWTEANARYGRATAYRILPPAGADLKSASQQSEQALLRHLKPEALGLQFRPVRSDALRAAGGATDFGMLFIGFSTFLIGAAAMLVALLFRLNVERRASQIGLLTALGVPRRRVSRTLLLEGAVIAAGGTLLGCGAATGYARLLIAGLQHWWAPGAATPHLTLHVGGASLAIGAGAGFLIAMFAMAWSIRSLMKLSPRTLLSGGAASDTDLVSRRVGKVSLLIALIGLATALALIIAVMAGPAISRAGAFFGTGACLLASSLAVIRIWMAKGWHSRTILPGPGATRRLAVRNAVRNRGRSLLAVGLIACAAFVIVAVGGSRRTVEENAFERGGGTGGFRLIAESAAPLGYDLGSEEGRKSLAVSSEACERLRGTTVYSCRLRPGDDTSCLNLYQATDPRIIGVPRSMIERGGFAFAGSLAIEPQDRANPWRLLNAKAGDGSIPVIGDENTVMWQLHAGLDGTMRIRDERGREIALRFVGMLSGSIFQGELLMAEEQLEKLFPSRAGYQFFVIETGADQLDRIKKTLDREMESYGWTGRPTGPLLAEFFGVENAYLSAFQSLGGLGLLLGTFGLGAVMLRNVLERRAELALLRALGWRNSAIGRVVLAENVALLVTGLAVGTGSALMAIAPRALSDPAAVPWFSLGMTLLGVLLAGTLVSAASLIPALRTPVLAALRRE